LDLRRRGDGRRGHRPVRRPQRLRGVPTPPRPRPGASGAGGGGHPGVSPHAAAPDSVDDVRAALADHDYLADEGLATAIFLAMRLHRPLLLEGEAGVGKTEVAKTLSRWTGGELIRLQCYEGIDLGQASHEW